jgi:hypothetical protein
VISVDQYGMTPRQLRHSKTYNRYDILPVAHYPAGGTPL